ncbi:hypothetical protein MKX03_016497 [Papaver bracteatum]|nr:hypothetical protein MKX03_016497 [Papaver bracteatum]
MRSKSRDSKIWVCCDSVRNPNRADFQHYHSSLQLMYSGNQIGFMFIPAGKIDSGRTQYMSATFTVDDFPFLPPSSSSSLMKMSGRVRVLRVFTHSVDSAITCTVAISVSDSLIDLFLGFIADDDDI